MANRFLFLYIIMYIEKKISFFVIIITFEVIFLKYKTLILPLVSERSLEAEELRRFTNAIMLFGKKLFVDDYCH